MTVEQGQVIGFRMLLLWRFRRGDEAVTAVRAVDTATHPDHQGRGIFRALTTVAVDELRDEGVGFVFNTPNDQSRPGYLKMGWVDIGRPPLSRWSPASGAWPAPHVPAPVPSCGPNRPRPVVPRPRRSTWVLRRVLRETGADHLLVAATARLDATPALAAPRLTWRALTHEEQPTQADLDLELGDLELF